MHLFRSAKTERSAQIDAAETTLYAELIRRGLPTDYARRTAEELDDHRADLLADLRAQHAEHPEAIANERLGESRALAKRIASDYQRRSWFGRWPLISFLLLPPVLLIAAWTTLFAAIGGLATLAIWITGSPGEYTTGRSIESARTFYYFAFAIISVAIPLAVAWWYSRYALTAAQSRVYLLLACLSFGLANGLLHHDLWIDPNDASQAMNGFGMPLPYIAAPLELVKYYAQPVQFAQLLIPVLVGGVLLYRDQCRRQRSLFVLSGQDGRLEAAA